MNNQNQNLWYTLTDLAVRRLLASKDRIGKSWLSKVSEDKSEKQPIYELFSTKGYSFSSQP